MDGQYDRFTERAKKVMALAKDEAKRFYHNYIGTEHLLLGLVAEGQGIAGRVLRNLGVDLPRMREALMFVVARGEGPVPDDPALLPRAQRMIDLAVEEADALGHAYVETEPATVYPHERAHSGRSILGNCWSASRTYCASKQEAPLTPEETEAVEHDTIIVDKLLAKLGDRPTPSGQRPSELARRFMCERGYVRADRHQAAQSPFGCRVTAYEERLHEGVEAGGHGRVYPSCIQRSWAAPARPAARPH
jgi:hypothetical protein